VARQIVLGKDYGVSGGVETGGPTLTKASVIPRKAAEDIFVYDPHTRRGIIYLENS